MKVKIIHNIFSSDFGVYKIGDIVDVNEDFINFFKGDIEILEMDKKEDIKEEIKKDIEEIKEVKDKMMRKRKVKNN